MLSRNEPCWCGSNRKYKKCHMAHDQALADLAHKGYIVPNREDIKTAEVIEGMKKSALITKGVFDYLEGKIRSGMTTEAINQMVHDYTVEHGGYPATLGYNGFSKSCCTSVNEVICHGIPGDEVIQDGDIINVDITTDLDGCFSDASRMYMIGDVSDRARNLVLVAKEALALGIQAVKPFESVDVIGETIEAFVTSNGYSVVRDLGGHGIGTEFHQAPHIHHYDSQEKGMIMVPGMTFTIEPMINEKAYTTETLEDGWTVKTIDGGLSAQWEHTILVTEHGAEIIV